MIPDKNIFLTNLKKIKADMPMMYRNHTIEPQTGWNAEKKLLDLTNEEKEQVNLRKQLSNEIIIDVEDKFRIDEISHKLKDKNLSFEIWDTGSRGVHFSIKFSNMANLELELRDRIRKYLIEELKADQALAKESQWVALEYTPHFKTGKLKTIINTIGDKKENIIPELIIDYCRKSLEPQEKTILTNEDFKDYVSKPDPYLHYALTNVIRDGERNDVLFKNLAIGLVRSGQTRQDIEKIATKIVENCPGKTMGEFMGWVEKAINGGLLDYNKSELVNWATKYEHPIFYDLFKEIDVEKDMSIKMLWDILWNYRVVCQDVWRDLCFYNMISTVLKEKVDDLRIHPIISSESGSGKDEGQNLVRLVLDEMGYKTSKPSEITDRTLIGAVNQFQVEVNTKKPKDYQNPVELGLLATMDWIAFGESESVFKPGAHNKKLQLILRQAMDKSRRVEKGVSGEILDLRTDTVFCFSTYPMPDIISKLLTNGLFQRSLYYDKKLEKDEHKKIVTHINKKKFDKTWTDNFNEKKYISLLVEKLRMVKAWYDENKNSIMFFKDSNKYVDDLWNNYEQSYYILPEYDIKVIQSIIRRASTNLYKLVVLNTVCKRELVITESVTNECFELIKMCLDSIRNILGETDSYKKQTWAVLMMLKNGSRTMMTIHDELKEKVIGMRSPNVRTKLIQKLKALEFISEFQMGKFTALQLTSKGMEELGY